MTHIIDLLEQAKQLEIDTDYLVRKTDNITHLLLRLGDGTYYPDEIHAHACETILVLEGECHLLLLEEKLLLKAGQQVTVNVNQLHKFLPESEACLSVIFEKQD